MSDKAIGELYRARSSIHANKNTTTAYYLVKFKNPKAAVNKRFRIVKRISYNFYIIASAPNILPDGDMQSAAPANSLWKATDNLLQLWQKHSGSKQSVELVATSYSDQVINDLKNYGTIVMQNPHAIVLHMQMNQLPGLLEQPYIIFANTLRKPHEDLVINDLDLGINNISAIAANYAEINGTGINIGIKEDRYHDDLDLLGRSFNSFKASNTTSDHATIMATLIGGNGNSFIKGIGVAPKARFTSSDFAQLMPDSAAIFKAFDIGVQNHSYGTGIENYYGMEAAAYDQQVFDNDSIVHVFSSGNIGTSAPSTGVYNGITGVANLSGTFKQAKNVLVIGGTGRTSQPEDLSSGGPAYDGRIKPELVANGEDGTSGAAALVSGTVALLQQAYKKQFYQLPSAALIKSVLITTADDIGLPGVDYKTGYGKLNALEALRAINENRFKKGTVINQQQIDYNITISAGSSEFKVSLAWNDTPASLNAPAALINDLDLYITTPGGQNLLPWGLSSYPAADSLLMPAKRQRDTLNNTEQVTLKNPAAGNYVIHVKGGKVSNSPQTFYIAYQTITANQFEWTYPSSHDQLFAADENYLRWQSSFNTASGKLSVSYDHGVTWQSISNISLKNNYYNWVPPDIFTTAMLKMDINGQAHISKEFTLSKPLNTEVGFNCTDGTLLHWKPQQQSKSYNIYTIRDNLLQKLTSTADTAIVIPAQQQSSSYFAISAQGDGFEGIKSYTINTTTQGVGCYIKTLLANVASKTILLDLQIGSTFNLRSITWEKLTGQNVYSTLGTTPVSTALTYQFTDANPKKGIQYYRAKLTTNDGKIIYSDLADATFLQDGQFTVYPNPVNTQLNILSADINNYEFKLYDAAGRLSLNKTINGLQNTIPINLNPGIYIYVITLQGKIVYRGKLIKV